MKKTALVLLLLLILAGCNRDKPAELTVMTHDSFDVSAEVIAEFEQAQQVKVNFLKAGDAGAVLNQAILSKNNPMADILFGVDNTFLSRALEADLFIPYASPLLNQISQNLKLDPSNRLLPVDYGDVCLNYDKAWFAEKKILPPADLEDLVKPEYKGLLVVQNPATSSPGMAFLLATVAHFGQPGYLDFWQGLKDNEVLISAGWEDAYWGQFSAASEGTRPLVVSYASSPPAEVFYSEKPLTVAPTAAIVAPGSAFRQIEFAGILKGSKNIKLAEKFMDFMLDTRFQEDIPLKMFVFPANVNARLPEVFTRHAKVAQQPAAIAPEKIAAGREEWLADWTKLMLR